MNHQSLTRDQQDSVSVRPWAFRSIKADNRDWVGYLLVECCSLLDGLVASHHCCHDARGQCLFCQNDRCTESSQQHEVVLAGLIFGWLGLIAAAGLPDRHQIVYLRYLAESGVSAPSCLWWQHRLVGQPQATSTALKQTMQRVNPFSGQFGITARLHNEFVAFDQKVSGLFRPDPLRVPGGIHTVTH